MAFLDNSADLILDVVLTDEGRKRLARGDNSFRVTKFALADDEINYTLYDTTHPSGSAYFDLDIMQTPVLEAFTSDLAVPNNYLITYDNPNLLYLPVMKENTQLGDTKKHTSKGIYVIAVDEETEELVYDGGNGIIKGESGGGAYIRVDQGLDTEDISYKSTLVEFDEMLVERTYNVQIDSRLGRIVSSNFEENAPQSEVSIEKILTYVLDLDVNPEFVMTNNNTTEASNTTEVLKGPRGTKFQFSIASSPELRTGTSYFTELGSTEVASNYKSGAAGNVYYIDTSIRIVGQVTGFNLNIPVRFIKKVA